MKEHLRMLFWATFIVVYIIGGMTLMGVGFCKYVYLVLPGITGGK